MLCDNPDKVIIKSIQRKYYKTVLNIQTGNEIKFRNEDKNQENKMILDI